MAMNVFLFLLLIYGSYSQSSIDILEPIVKISPVRNDGKYGDRFGYSVTAHQLVKLSPEDSFQKALDNTVIMVGAPDGQFPGGISGINPNGLVCREVYPDLSDDQLLALNDSEIWPCYENITTGLVYTCPLTSGQCGATLGNGSATGPDGLLFDRVGNTKEYVKSVDDYRVIQNKNGGLMGKKIYSSGEYFISCAPLWEYKGNTGGETQPRGRCVYSDRNLTEFAILYPCDQPGSSNNQNNEGFCTSGTSVHVSDNGSFPIISIGVPGRHFSRGGAFYYYNLDDPKRDRNGIQENNVPASRGVADLFVREFVQNVYEISSSYYGFAITSGFLTSNITKDFIMSAPRWNEYPYAGRVYVITELETLPTIYVEGEQFGETFGYSLAAVDLNGDGWDDLVISAPMYSENSRPELGRVYIFLNNEGVFEKNTVIIGTAVSGRFGISVEGLGDINNDGYEDFAVSAPYEGSGVVYIYHGQQMDVNGTIVNTQYQQRIDGSTMVDRVSDLTDVNLFGFSISGTVDVDNNLYRDLVIGAHDSQSVFVLRSIPVATVNISITTDVEEVELDSYDCTDFNGQPISCFNIRVCGMFDGRGLDLGFTANYSIQEVIIMNQRLFFDDLMNSGTIRSLKFTSPNIETCDDSIVYIMNDTSTISLNDFSLTVEMLQISRPDVIVDTNLSPSDLSQSPVITSLPDTLDVNVATQCGEDEICDSDLRLEIINITYLTLSGEAYEDQSQLTVDAIERVDVSLSFENLGEIAFNAFITFELPRNIFTHRQVLPQSTLIRCNDTTLLNLTHANYRCPLRPTINKGDVIAAISLRWQVEPLRGDEGTVTIPISIFVPTGGINRENITNNNKDYADFSITSISQYSVAILFSSDQVSYQGNSTPRVDNIASNLGEDIQLSVTLRNDGPSTIRNATLNIFIPAQLPSVTRDNYFYYPATLTSTDSSVKCDTSVLNPEGFDVTSTSRRRRRSVSRSRGHTLKSVLSRTIRQESIDLDCEQNPELCFNLKCSVTELDSSITLDILGYLDERFYDRKTAAYTLKAYVNVSVDNNFIDTTGSTTNSSSELVLNKFLTFESNPDVPWYVIAAPVVGAIIFIIILAIALYCFGFFRRKKHQKDDKIEGVDDDGETFEQFAQNPFGDGDKSTKPKDNSEATKL